MNNKYKIIGRPKQVVVNLKKVNIYRIKALKTFKNEATGITIKKGEVGGWITEKALSQEGNSWVDKGSVVVGEPNQVCVSGDAYVANSVIHGNVIVHGNAVVSNSELQTFDKFYSEICDHSRVIGSFIIGNTKVAGKAQLGNCRIIGQALIDGKSFLENCRINNSNPNKTITIRLFGERLSDYALYDRLITDKTPIVNDVSKE